MFPCGDGSACAIGVEFATSTSETEDTIETAVKFHVEGVYGVVFSLGLRNGALHQMLRFEFKLRHDVESSVLDTISVKLRRNKTYQNPKLSFQTWCYAPS